MADQLPSAVDPVSGEEWTALKFLQAVRTDLADVFTELSEIQAALAEHDTEVPPDEEPPPDEESPPDEDPANPGALLNIGPTAGQNHFNIGIGGSNAHADHSQDEIAGGFSQDPEFVLTSDRASVQFRVGVAAGTTPGSTYPRSELREVDGTSRLMAWDSDSGTHYMHGKTRITHVAQTKPWVCIAQIHDADDDVLRIQTEGRSPTALKLVARHTLGAEERTVELLPSYTLGVEIDWRIEVVDGNLEVKINNEVKLTGALTGTGCYFKAGCYAQSNETTENGDSTQYFAVELRDLTCGHSLTPPPPSEEDGQTAAEVLGWGSPTWRDEFDYTGPPDPVKWQNAPENGMPGHNRNGRRIAYCTTVADGAMTLHGYPNGDTAWVRQNLPTKYGRWEIRSRSRNVGTSGSLYHVLHLIWPTSERWPDDGEYDWLEYTNPDQQSAEAFLHYPHRNMPVQQEHAVKNGVDMTEWHNFAFQWDENGLTGWIDGVQWFHYADGAGRGGRRNIQDMPEGKLTCQLDNFHGSGMREALFELAWVRFWEV